MIHFKRIKRLRTFRTAWKKVNPLFGQIFTLSLSLSLISFSSYNRVYQGFRLNLVIGSRMIIFVSLLTTFNVSNNFRDDLVIAWNWLKPKIRPSKPSLACPTPWYTRYNSMLNRGLLLLLLTNFPQNENGLYAHLWRWSQSRCPTQAGS